MFYISGDGVGPYTQTAGTRNQVLVGGVGNMFTHLQNFRYTDTGTGHTITAMRSASRAQAAAVVAAAGTALSVTIALTDGDGNAIAANDFVGVRLNDGTWLLSAVSAWDATNKIITLTTAVPANKSILKGAKVVCYGTSADTFHAGHKFTGGASSSTVNFPAANTPDVSLCRNTKRGEPILMDSNNATNAGTFNQINVGFAKL